MRKPDSSPPGRRIPIEPAIKKVRKWLRTGDYPVKYVCECLPRTRRSPRPEIDGNEEQMDTEGMMASGADTSIESRLLLNLKLVLDFRLYWAKYAKGPSVV